MTISRTPAPRAEILGSRVVVNATGYEWVDGLDHFGKPARILKPREPIQAVAYDPFEPGARNIAGRSIVPAGAYMSLMRGADGESAFLDFAERFGSISYPERQVEGEVWAKNQKMFGPLVGLPTLLDWRMLRAKLRDLHAAWEIATGRAAGDLKRFIRRDRKGLYWRWPEVLRIYQREHAGNRRPIDPRMIEVPIAAHGLDSLASSSELPVATRVFVASAVSQHLQGVRARLLFAQPSRFESLGLRFVTTDLETALWLQFAMAMEGAAAYRKCERPACRNYFATGAGSSRSDRLFCSATCRANHGKSKSSHP